MVRHLIMRLLALAAALVLAAAGPATAQPAASPRAPEAIQPPDANETAQFVPRPGTSTAANAARVAGGGGLGEVSAGLLGLLALGGAALGAGGGGGGGGSSSVTTSPATTGGN